MEFGGKKMRHFVFLIVVVFSIIVISYVNRDESNPSKDYISIKVYADSSFINSWGPGPELRDLFEKQTGIKVNFQEMKDSMTLFQKASLEGQGSNIDVILSIDQFDIVRWSDKMAWKNIESRIDREQTTTSFSKQLTVEGKNFFIPYDWSPIAFNGLKNKNITVNNLNDLLNPDLKGKIALIDPRTSSVGLQFLVWVMKTKSEPEAVEYLKLIFKSAHSVSSSWSMAYGLFKSQSVDVVLSYATSPFYHLIEEKNENYKAYEFTEGHPIQVEYAGIPEFCNRCDAALQFIHFLQSPEAQKIIMTKNYMLPVNKMVQEGTVFDTLKIFETIKDQSVSREQLQKWLNIWVEIRQNAENSL